MPIVTDRQSVGANATVAVMTSKIPNIIPADSPTWRLRLYATAAAVGLNITFMIGTEIFTFDQEANAQNRMPIVPDDFLAEAMGFAGDPIVINWRNTTGAAIVGFLRLELYPA